MHLDWLYGRTANVVNAGSSIITRSKVLDTDTLRDIARYVDSNLGIDSRFYVEEPLREVPASELGSLSSAERNRLYLRGESPNGGEVGVYFARNHRPEVYFTVAADPKVRDGLVHIINTGGPSMVRWSEVARLFPFVLFVALVGSWIWLVATEPIPIPGQVLGYLVLPFAFIAAVMAYRWMSGKYFAQARGHRIRDESRAETHARRADTHKDVKVAVISVAVTLLATLLINLIWPSLL